MTTTIRPHFHHPLRLSGALPVFAGLFLLAHAFVHPWLWAFPRDGGDAPQGESWLLHDIFGMGSTAQTATALVAWGATVLFAVAGVMLLARQTRWRGIAIAGAFLSISAMVLDFTPGLLVGVLINVAILAVASSSTGDASS